MPTYHNSSPERIISGVLAARVWFTPPSRRPDDRIATTSRDATRARSGVHVYTFALPIEAFLLDVGDEFVDVALTVVDLLLLPLEVFN